MDITDPSNSMLDEERQQYMTTKPPRPPSLFGLKFTESDDEASDNNKYLDDQYGYETVVRNRSSEDDDARLSCCSPVLNYSESTTASSSYHPYRNTNPTQSEEPSGYETVVKMNNINPPLESYDDTLEDGQQSGFEAVWKGDVGQTTIEQSFSMDSHQLEPRKVSFAEGKEAAARGEINIAEGFEENETHMRITKAITNVVNERNGKNARKRFLAIIAIFCLLVILCIILGVFLSGATDKGDIVAVGEPLKGEDTSGSTQVPTSSGLRLPDETWDAIEKNPSGPQAKAFEWFWNDYENHVEYSSQRMLQRFVLATLYYATGGDSWVENTGWLSEEHECQWFSSVSTQPQYYEQGVTSCQSNSDTVTSLVLIDNNLTASSLPEELYLLSDMRQIDLQMNTIQGTLSPSIVKLDKLARLRLGRNEMTGKLPDEIGSLSLLQVLSLYSNKFSGSIPSSIGEAEDLIQIWFSDNLLTGSIPTVIGQLSELQVAWMDQNRLEGGVPSEFGLLPRLQDLMLHENRLVGSLPTEFGVLGDYLVNLDLRSNRLTGLVPSEMGLMTRLNSLVLHENKFSGQLPTEIGLMAQIENLYISANDLTGTIPTQIGDCQKLNILWLNSNAQLTGTIPSELGKLTGVKDVFLSRDSLYGSLPSEIGLMVGLRTLALEQNGGLTGSLPTELAQLRGLSKITITRTGISGTIPEDICEVHEDALRFDCSATLCGCGDCPC